MYLSDTGYKIESLLEYWWCTKKARWATEFYSPFCQGKARQLEGPFTVSVNITVVSAAVEAFAADSVLAAHCLAEKVNEQLSCSKYQYCHHTAIPACSSILFWRGRAAETTAANATTNKDTRRAQTMVEMGIAFRQGDAPGTKNG